MASDQPALFWTETYFVLQQSADGDAQTLTEVDLFISTQRIKVLNADSQVSLLQPSRWQQIISIIPNDATSVWLRVRTDSVNLKEAVRRSEPQSSVSWEIYEHI